VNYSPSKNFSSNSQIKIRNNRLIITFSKAGNESRKDRRCFGEALQSFAAGEPFAARPQTRPIRSLRKEQVTIFLGLVN
jgi:hypothetical protein